MAPRAPPGSPRENSSTRTTEPCATPCATSSRPTLCSRSTSSSRVRRRRKISSSRRWPSTRSCSPRRATSRNRCEFSSAPRPERCARTSRKSSRRCERGSDGPREDAEARGLLDRLLEPPREDERDSRQKRRAFGRARCQELLKDRPRQDVNDGGAAVRIDVSRPGRVVHERHLARDVAATENREGFLARARDLERHAELSLIHISEPTR